MEGVARLGCTTLAPRVVHSWSKSGNEMLANQCSLLRQMLPAAVSAFISSLTNKNITPMKGMIWKELHE